MSLAQRFERRLESLVGGAFARVFKGQVEPVELGSALQREAGDKRNVMGNGQVLVPNRYRVTLSPSDFDRLESWEAQLTAALAELVQEHIDENSWRTIGDIEVYLAKDEALHTGVFGVASRMDSAAPPRRRPHDSLSMPAVQGAAPDAYLSAPPVSPPIPAPMGPVPAPPAPVQGLGAGQALGQGLGAGQGLGQGPEPTPNGQYPQSGHADQYGPPTPPRNHQPAHPNYPPNYPRPQARQQIPALLVVDTTNESYNLPAGRTLVGRGMEADLQLMDQGVSRRHCEITYDGTVATAHDLGSTNGTAVNGHTISTQPLQHGDVLRIGHTRLVFHQPAMQTQQPTPGRG